MSKFNLSEWALNHRSLVWYFMLVFLVAGTYSFVNLGREEDPHFTIKTMVVQANWPGASVEETIEQVTDRIEKKLEELDALDFTRSVTTAGKTIVFVNLRPSIPSSEVESHWVRVRHIVSDMRHQFPEGVVGPFFNDRFGDVFGTIYAFTSDGLSPRQLRDHLEDARARILTLPAAGKVELIGAQDEVVYLEFSPRKTAALGLDAEAILRSLDDQNAITPSGVIHSGSERLSVRVSGQFRSEDDLRDVNLRVNERFFRLADVATITRGYAEPARSMFRINGQDAIGLAIGMKPNGNLLEFGASLQEMMDKIENDLPIGIDVVKVADQAEVVQTAVSGFTTALFEAIAIVLAVSFISLGLRAGIVVSLSIPLVLAITFLFMEYSGISLQRVSLGALIIALGLLVDDAMIAVEMMVARLELGDSLHKAATYVYSHTAFPMLTGTLVTIAGFIPIGLNSSPAGEYTYSLFVVIGVSLIVSWVVAVLFAPLLGVTFLPKVLKQHSEKAGFVMRNFARALLAAMRWRWTTIGLTLAAFIGSLYAMTLVEQQFFPESDRAELVIDWRLPSGSSISETAHQMVRFEQEVLAGDDDIVHWSSYVGQGAARFILTLDAPEANPFIGQMVVVAKDRDARDRLRAEFQQILHRDFSSIDTFVKYLELGPPVGRPVQYRISGPDIETLRDIARKFASILSSEQRLDTISYDWNEAGRAVRVDVIQDKARKLGISSKMVALHLNTVVEGLAFTQLRDGTNLIDVVVRAGEEERGTIETLQNLQIATGNGTSVPLAAIANLEYTLEQPMIWRRDRVPTITIAAGILDKTMPDTIVQALQPAIDDFANSLPAGYSVATAGTVEESAKSQGPILAVIPLMMFVTATILMVQLQSFQKLLLVVSVAPLGVIGVVAAMLLSQKPLGFVAILGILALVGILIRNSVILIIQIEALIEEGKPGWEAVFEATRNRMRPITLTAAAAGLALIPISRDVFWGPMAYAMMGGIVAGTLITLFFLPAFYVAWFRIKEPSQGSAEELRSAQLHAANPFA